jgi:hypothetical protein
VIEHPRRPPWRAGYVIVPVALAVGALQVFGASDYDRIAWSSRPQASASDVPPSAAGETVRASQAERQPAGRVGFGANAGDPLPPGPGPQAGNVEAANTAAAAGPPRVFILHRAGIDNAVPAIQLAVYLQARGFAVTDIRAVDEPIERPSVRYFSEDDQPDSRRLAEAIEAFFANAPDQAPDEVMNLSHLAPEPRQGKVEVWLPEPPDEAS